MTRATRGLRVPCVAMRRVQVPIGLLAAAGLLGACGAASPTATSTEPTTLPVTPTAVVTATPGATLTPTPPATPPVPCVPGQFEIGILNTQGAAGTIYATFEIRNTATADCTEDGYAKLQMLASGGEPAEHLVDERQLDGIAGARGSSCGHRAAWGRGRAGPWLFPRLLDRCDVLCGTG